METPKEVFCNALNKQPVKRVPSFLFDITLGLEFCNFSTPSLFPNGKLDGKKSAECLIATKNNLNCDASIGSIACIDFSSIGAKIQRKEDGIPVIASSPFSDSDKLYSFQPSDMETDQIDQVILSHNTVRKLDPTRGIVSHIMSPLSISISLRGLERFLMDLLIEENYSKDLIKFGSDVFSIYANRILSEAENDAVLVSGAYDNIDLIGPELMEKFTLKPLKDAVNLVSNYKNPIIFHPHGTLSSDFGLNILDRFSEMSIDCIYYGEANDSVIIANHVKDKMSVMGGVDTYTTIFLGPNERVMSDVEKCMLDMKEFDYIFSCSCSVDRGLPIDRLKIMMCAVEKYSSKDDF